MVKNNNKPRPPHFPHPLSPFTTRLEEELETKAVLITFVPPSEGFHPDSVAREHVWNCNQSQEFGPQRLEIHIEQQGIDKEYVYLAKHRLKK